MQTENQIPVKTIGRPSEYGFEKLIMDGQALDFLFKDGYTERRVQCAARNYAKHHNLVFVSRSIKHKKGIGVNRYGEEKQSKKKGIRIIKIK